MKNSSLPLWAEVDVLVVGGGPSGFAAAIAAGQNGARTILVERHSFLGGMATSALVMPWNVWAKPVTIKDIGGVYKSLIERLEKYNGTYRFSDKTVLRSFDPSMVKIIMDAMCMDVNVKLLFSTLAVDVEMTGDRLDGIVLQNKSGRGIIKARHIVDATGDGDVAVLAGASYKMSEKNGARQPGTLIFTMAGVDIKALIEYLQTRKDEIGGWPPDESMGFGDGDHICLSGLSGCMRQAKEENKDLPVDQIILCSTPNGNPVTINMTRVFDIDVTDPMALSAAEVEARRQVLKGSEILKKFVPGFGKAYLAEIAVQMGIRESRRVVGDYTLTSEDITSGRSHLSTIAKLFNVGHLDFTQKDSDGKKKTLFNYLNQPIEIPYECILPTDLSNLLVAGRCISTSAGAFGYIRTQTACFATGQAAGTAAALSVLHRHDLRRLPVDMLQDRLQKDGIEL